jgi:flavin reductase (DIM6/NTAB) family NADH-FMN oxidoreductase RutF
MIDPDAFRIALGRFASGVTVVTASSKAGEGGMTVTAFSSLSLTPPLVLICIDHQARMYHVLEDASHFAVNVLDASQEWLARRFADPDLDRFDGVVLHRAGSGAPILDGVLATLECRLADAYPGGDHTIFVGIVESTNVRDGQPLIYYRGSYRALDR